MSKNNSIRFYLVFLVLLATAVPFASAATTEKKGMTCQAPDFSFSWYGYSNSTLTATADPAQTFEIKLRYLRDPNDGNAFAGIQVPQAKECCNPSKDKSCAGSNVSGDSDVKKAAESCVAFEVRATPDGNQTTVILDRGAILKASGRIGFHWKALKEDKEACEARLEGPGTSLRVMDKHDLRIDLGQVYALESGGNWDSNAEAALNSTSRWFNWLATGFAARYSAIGAVDDSETTMATGMGSDDGGDGTGTGDGDTGGDGAMTPFNPFESGGGVFEADFHVAVSPKPWPRLAFVVGLGFSSVPKPAGADLETRERTFIGLRNSVEGYNSGRPGDSLANSKGFLQIGISEDDLWKDVILEPASDDGTVPAVLSDESERYVLEGQLELPRVGSDWLRIAVRLFASLPRSGDGPSDVRVSALASVDPRSWFGGIGKKE